MARRKDAQELWLAPKSFGQKPYIPFITRREKIGEVWAIFPTLPGVEQGTVRASSPHFRNQSILYDKLVAATEPGSTQDKAMIQRVLGLDHTFIPYDHVTQAMQDECERQRKHR